MADQPSSQRSSHFDSAERIARDLAMLPPKAQIRLRAGPMEDPDCRACEALDMAEEWLNGPAGHAYAGEHPDGWLKAGSAVRFLRDWHDPVKGSTFLRPLGRAVEHVGWEITTEPDAGLRARSAFFAPGGYGHTAINEMVGPLSYARCALLYMLAGWRPNA